MRYLSLLESTLFFGFSAFKLDKDKLPFAAFKGTHYEIGQQIGHTFRRRIWKYLSTFKPMSQFIEFYKTPKGQTIYTTYHDWVQQRYPKYMDEVRGISDGSKVPFEQIFLLHLRNELDAILRIDCGKECTDVLVSGGNVCAIGHNEDANPAIGETGFLVQVEIDDSSYGDKEFFTAYCYPGVIPGNAFGFNMHGLVLTVDACAPKRYALNGTPRQFLTRAMLASASEDDILNMLTSEHVAYGFSVNFVCSPSLTLWNVEVAPGERDSNETLISCYLVSNDYYIHLNRYERLEVEEIPNRTESSRHRFRRAHQLPPPRTVANILEILGDDGESQWPIFRTPSDKDFSLTVATALFDLHNGFVDIWRSNPKWSKPIYRFRLRDGEQLPCGGSADDRSQLPQSLS